MATMITEECINCGACEPECPNTAIYQGGVEFDGLDGAKHGALSNEIFYIVPEKCTECVGFYDHEACAAVCPVDCCVPNPNIPESEAVLLDRARQLHPDKTFGSDSPSRFKEGGGGNGAAAPAGDGAAPAAAPTAAPAAKAAPAAAPAQVLRFGKVEKKVAPPLQQPPSRTVPYRGELPLDYEEALEVASPAGAGALPAPLRLLIAVSQPLLGALPAATKDRLEAAIGNPRVFSSAGATGLNILLHLVALPIIATVFAVVVRGDSLYSEHVRPWFMWGFIAAILEAIVRLREAVVFARPMSEIVLRGSFYGPLLLPLAAPILSLAKGHKDVGQVAVEGYYATAGAFDEKRERERRYGEIFAIEERPGGYLFRLELPRRIPPSGVSEELGLGGEMPDYALELSLRPGWFEVHGKVVDPRLRTIAAVAPAFPPDFTTRVPIGEPTLGFVQRYADKVLEVVILKRSAAGRLPGAANAA